MTSVNAEEYFKAHQAQEKEYVPVSTARKIKAGQTVLINTVLGIDAFVKAPEDGYEVKGPSDSKKFLTKSQLKQQTVAADELELPAAKEDLTAEELKLIKPVKKGEEIYVNPGLPIVGRAEQDGFIVTDEDGKYSRFVSNYELTSSFNYAGKKYKTHDEADIIVQKDQAPLKGIILTEDVTFAFKAGEYEAPKGSLLFVNPDDEDGYTVDNANLGYRVATAPTVKKAKGLLSKLRHR